MSSASHVPIHLYYVFLCTHKALNVLYGKQRVKQFDKYELFALEVNLWKKPTLSCIENATDVVRCLTTMHNTATAL